MSVRLEDAPLLTRVNPTLQTQGQVLASVLAMSKLALAGIWEAQAAQTVSLVLPHAIVWYRPEEHNVQEDFRHVLLVPPVPEK